MKKIINVKRKSDRFPVWQLIPNQYEWNIYLCLTDRPVADIIPVFNAEYNVDFNDDDVKHLSDRDDFTLFNTEYKTAIIVLRNYSKKPANYSTLAHEIYHIASLIAQELQIPMDFDHTTEVWAYFMSFYMDVCIQTLDQYLEELEKKKNRIKKKVVENIDNKDSKDNKKPQKK